MNKILSLKYILLLFISLLGFGLRTINLSQIPPGLNRDEAAIGYTAYSILKTGRDEYGKFLPVSVKSFGDWKLPGYIYSAVPLVAVLGLIETATRFPSVIWGTLTVIFTYLIVRELFRREALAVTAALLVSISPWAIFFSRVAAEANLAVCLVAAAFYIFLRARKNFLLPLGTLALSLTLLTYHGNHVFTPLIFICFLIYFRNKFMSRAGAVGILLFVLISAFIYGQTLFSADRTKISGLLTLNDPSLVHENIVMNRLIMGNGLLGKMFNNKAVYFLEGFADSYIRGFSPDFLFISGGGNLSHNIPDFGNAYLIEAPFILLGLYFLFARREKSAWLLLAWLLISPIGAALTKDAPHSAREFAILPALLIVAAYGIYHSVLLINHIKLRQVFISILLLLYIGSLSIFAGRYFLIFPYKRYFAWGDAYKGLTLRLLRYNQNYSEVFVSRPDYSPYIYYLFYQKSDPNLVQKNLVRYPPTSEGFEHVKMFDGITYKKNNWSDELLTPNRLYIDWAESVPHGATNSAVLITKDVLKKLNSGGQPTENLQIGDEVVSHLVDTIYLPDKSPFIYFIATELIKSPLNQVTH